MNCSEAVPVKKAMIEEIGLEKSKGEGLPQHIPERGTK